MHGSIETGLSCWDVQQWTKGIFVTIMKLWVCLQYDDITNTDMCPSCFITVDIDKQQTAHMRHDLESKGTYQTRAQNIWTVWNVPSLADLYVSGIIQHKNLQCKIECFWNNNTEKILIKFFLWIFLNKTCKVTWTFLNDQLLKDWAQYKYRHRGSAKGDACLQKEQHPPTTHTK